MKSKWVPCNNTEVTSVIVNTQNITGNADTFVFNVYKKKRGWEFLRMVSVARMAVRRLRVGTSVPGRSVLRLLGL